MGVTYETNGSGVRLLVNELGSVAEADRIPLLQKFLGTAACRQLAIYPIPPNFKLSVVIPVYNEKQWVGELVRRVQAVPVAKEIILVDDCSTDGTEEILREVEEDGT